MWKYTGAHRPPFATEPGPGQESVWDYPRPPKLELSRRLVVVQSGEIELARTTRSRRVLETASPPTYYLPPADVDGSQLLSIAGRSHCEWKGPAAYFALITEPQIPVAWRYPEPRRAFASIKDYVSFYPGRIACSVDGERVQPQPGEFYGGWITAELVGPFKGEPGTGHW